MRLDGGVGFAGAVIAPFYDSLLAKVTCTGATLELARCKIIRALGEFHIRGVKTNIAFLQNVLQHPTFIDSSVCTTFIDNSPELFQMQPTRNRAQKILLFLADLIVNGTSIQGQLGEPGLRDFDPVVPKIPVCIT